MKGFYNNQMNQKSGLASNSKFLKQEKISFSKIPNQSKLFLDYQYEPQTLSKFYPTINSELSSIYQNVLANYKTDRNKLCDILLNENKKYGVGEKSLQNIKKLRENDCVAVLTGQQSGLFSGPLYTIYKALSAVKLADKLNNQGVNAVPVFWIASEDHDFAEISKTFYIDNNSRLSSVKNIPDKQNDGAPISFIEIEDNIKDSIIDWINNQETTEFSDKLESLLVSTYKTGENFSSAFGKLLVKLLNEFGLIYVSPMNRDLRKLCIPIYESAINNYEAITKQLLERNNELKAAGYHSQVLVEEDFFPFFYIDKNNIRNSLRYDKESGKIRTQDSKYEFSVENFADVAVKAPESLSPNALLRPVIQDYLFPTICYFGGGAEIAYFGQNSVIYELLNRPVTQIRHRSSFTIIQGRHRRTLNKYALNFIDLFEGKEKIMAEIIENYLNRETSNVFTETEKSINTELNNLDQHLAKAEPTLSDNLANRRQKILWHLETLRKKFHKAEILKHQIVQRRINSLFADILPDNVLQERYLNTLYFINIYGENFIDWIYYSIDSEEKDHQILIF